MSVWAPIIRVGRPCLSRSTTCPRSRTQTQWPALCRNRNSVSIRAVSPAMWLDAPKPATNRDRRRARRRRSPASASNSASNSKSRRPDRRPRLQTRRFPRRNASVPPPCCRAGRRGMGREGACRRRSCAQYARLSGKKSLRATDQSIAAKTNADRSPVCARSLLPKPQSHAGASPGRVSQERSVYPKCYADGHCRIPALRKDGLIG